MRRLYLQIYVTVVGILVLLQAMIAIAWWTTGTRERMHELHEDLAEVLSSVLPPAGADAQLLERSLNEIVDPFEVDAMIVSRDLEVLARSGESIPRADLEAAAARFEEHSSAARFTRGRGLEVFALPDGRLFVLRLDAAHPSPPGSLVVIVLLTTLATAIGAYPIVRRLTRRLEALQRQVDAFGRGELSARVDVAGKDEIAQLALSFNTTAERIERLVEEKRRVLAAASHELRTPLARIEVAAELLADERRPDLRDRIQQDVRELDELISELLVASKLDSAAPELRCDDVDLLAILAEEASSYGVGVTGPSAAFRGDARLLRRLARNLLENAKRHAGGATEASISLEPEGDWRIVIADRGPGIGARDRDRVFEPFYRPATSRDAEPEATLGAGGMGLALVKQIAELHGGSVACRAREGGGTQLEVRLPSSRKAHLRES